MRTGIGATSRGILTCYGRTRNNRDLAYWLTADERLSTACEGRADLAEAGRSALSRWCCDFRLLGIAVIDFAAVVHLLRAAFGISVLRPNIAAAVAMVC